MFCVGYGIYEGAELPSVYFITNTKYCITYLALTQLFPVLVSHPEMYTVCSTRERSSRVYIFHNKHKTLYNLFSPDPAVSCDGFTS